MQMRTESGWDWSLPLTQWMHDGLYCGLVRLLRSDLFGILVAITGGALNFEGTRNIGGGEEFGKCR